MGGKDRDVTTEDLLKFGKANDIRGAESVIKDVSDILLSFKEYAMKNGVSEVYAEVIQKKLCQNLCVKYGPDEEQSVGGDSGQSSIFDHIVIRKNKEKYTINASLNGTRLREKKILHEDYMAYSFGIVSKEKLAEKYFQDEINNI